MIDTNEKLAAYLPTLAAAAWVALDTEADSLHAYPEKVCLIQIGTAAGDELIDPLAGITLDPLLEALDHHELVMHGADYDLRLLRKHHEFVPGAIFDTMLAARLLGQRQFSLIHLVERYLGVKLDKGPQKADWAQRPLTPRMETYARDDTRHLKPLADKLKLELQHQARLRWHQEACARLVADCAAPNPPDPEMVWRVKGSHQLGRPALAILRELWNWREQEAIAANRPPYFVLSHETLVAVADAAAHGRYDDHLLPPRMSARRRAGLQAAIELGRSVPQDKYPEFPRQGGRRLTDAEKRRFHELQTRRDRHATELGIDPTLIASKAMLLDLARSPEQSAPELMNWQKALFQP